MPSYYRRPSGGAGGATGLDYAQWILDLTSDEADAISTPPGSLVWLNSSLLDSAAVSSGVLNMDHDGTNSDLRGAGGVDPPIGYRRIDNSGDPTLPFWITFRMRNDGDASWENSGVVLFKDTDSFTTNFVQMGGRGQNSYSLSYKGVTVKNGISPLTVTNYNWYRMICVPDTDEIFVTYNEDTGDTVPTTGWLTDTPWTGVTWLTDSVLRCGVFAATDNTSNSFTTDFTYFSITGRELL